MLCQNIAANIHQKKNVCQGINIFFCVPFFVQT